MTLRAHTLLMHVINDAAKGPATAMDYTCNGNAQYPPFRNPDWFTSDRDRARYHGEAFGLTVDWIYPTLTAQDKQTIRQVYLRWSQDIIERGYHHPEPVGMVNNPTLLANQSQVRFSDNTYFTAHIRNLPSSSSPPLLFTSSPLPAPPLNSPDTPYRSARSYSACHSHHCSSPRKRYSGWRPWLPS